MQILLYVWYFLRSAALRGLFNTIGLIKDEVHFEKKYGIESAAIKKSESERNYHYQGASYRVLFRIFDVLHPNYKDYLFCDIGCGKGRVLFLARQQGFTDLCGIELDKELLDVAATNLNGKEKPTVHLVHSDALAFNYPDRNAIYFLFNPFNQEVLEKVIERILSTSHRNVIFVYMNPIHRIAFDKRKDLSIDNSLKTRWYTEALIYRRVVN